MSPDTAARAIGALLLIIIALSFLPAWLLSLWRAPTTRRCDDPAADPHAEPYGEMPGFSAQELRRHDSTRRTRR
ncbi:MAG: hypothetical protein ACOY6K_12545 [Pseudomonadota bacterium]